MSLRPNKLVGKHHQFGFAGSYQLTSAICLLMFVVFTSSLHNQCAIQDIETWVVGTCCRPASCLAVRGASYRTRTHISSKRVAAIVEENLDAVRFFLVNRDVCSWAFHDCTRWINNQQLTWMLQIISSNLNSQVQNQMVRLENSVLTWRIPCRGFFRTVVSHISLALGFNMVQSPSRLEHPNHSSHFTETLP